MIDLLKNRNILLELYRPDESEFSLIDVPELPFALIDGDGPPELEAGKAIRTLFHLIRRQARERQGKAFVEPPVEMLYWADDPRDLAAGKRENWKWRVMITLPAGIDPAAFAASVEAAREHMDPVSRSLRMERFAEGRCVQILHAGPADDVPPLLRRLYTRFLPDHGLEPAGAYHEIYLDDWSRVAPEKRKIILRQPVRPIAKGANERRVK